MNPTVRSNLDDSYVEGKTCSICGKQALKVVHLGAYPDYVNCESCGSAFVTEEGGERVMYGKIPAAYPDTSRFALQQWVWPEAIDRRASTERRSHEPAPIQAPPPAVLPPEPTPESAVPEESVPPAEVSAQLDEPTQETLPVTEPEIGWPPAAPSDEAPASTEPEAESEQPADKTAEAASGWAPEHTFQAETEAPAEGEPAPTEFEERPEASVPTEGEPTLLGAPAGTGAETPATFGGQGSEDDLLDDLWGEPPGPAETGAGEPEDSLPQAESPAPGPEGGDLSITPSWVDEVEGQADEGAQAETPWTDEAEQAYPADQTPATPSWIDDLDAAPEEGDTSATPSWIDEMDAAAADLEASAAQEEGDTDAAVFGAEAGGAEFAFPWGETPSEPEPEEIPEDEWAPFGLGAPPESKAEEEPAKAQLPQPVSPFEEGEWEDTGMDSGVPLPPDETAMANEAEVPRTSRDDAAEEVQPTAEPDQAEAMATAYWGGQGGPAKAPAPPPEPEPTDETGEPARYEPPPDKRYRVVLKGTKAYFPEGVCAHCFYRPAPARMSILAAIARGAGVGEREITTLRVPVCTECKQRSSARSEEQHTAQLQAHLIGVLTGLFLVVCGLAFGLLDLKNNIGAALVGLVVLGTLGYIGPAVPLLLRASRMPRPADAGFVGSTLRVPGDTESTETAFEWRNERYAHAFRKTNERTAVSDVTRVRVSDE